MAWFEKGVTIGGRHTYRDLGLTLVDGSEQVGLPEIQAYQVEVPGRDGLLDLTEALTGGVAFRNRECSWEFVDARERGERTEALAALANAVHGRRLAFQLDERPGLTGRGRFSAEVSEDRLGFTRLRLTADCDPYLMREPVTLKVNAAGGIAVSLEGGRMPACPTFEVASETLVSMGDASARLQPGAWRVSDLWLSEGRSVVYLNSYLGDGNVPISDHADEAVADHAGAFVSDLMWEGVRGAALSVADVAGEAVEARAGVAVAEAEHAVATDTEKYAVYIQYEWGEL